MSTVDVINTTFRERMKTYSILTDEIDNEKEQNKLASKLSMMTDAQLDAAAYTTTSLRKLQRSMMYILTQSGKTKT
jgi:aspartate 1-decarboxylase